MLKLSLWTIYYFLLVNMLIDLAFCYSWNNRKLIKKQSPKCNKIIKEAEQWMDYINPQLMHKSNLVNIANYNQETNINEETSANLIKTLNEFNDWLKDIIKIARHYRNEISSMRFCNKTLTRLLDIFNYMKETPLSEDDSINKRISSLMTNMGSIYGATTVSKGDKIYYLEPELTDLLATSRDYNQQFWAWKSWHDAVGPKIKDKFTEVVFDLNQASQENGVDNLADYWLLHDFDQLDIEDIMSNIMHQIRPLFLQLHAYVRNRLIEAYPKNDIRSNGPLPIHLLGNMWGQSWMNILDLLQPYPNIKTANITKALIDADYTPLKMFKLAESFFVSIGFEPMTKLFWENSYIVKPADNRSFECHGEANDMLIDGDFRIKMCTTVTQTNFETIHHEMGHIEYYMQYQHQPMLFRAGANAAFHEAVGDTIGLSVTSNKHLQAIGLMAHEESTYESLINSQMEMALKKVAFLPFAYVMDKWRFKVFRGEISPSQYNSAWWEMRKQYQGVEPTIPRGEEYFDPGAKYHIPTFVGYSRYFLSFISQFQFHENLCKITGHDGPIQNCDIFKSKKAGKVLHNALSLGSSKPWPQVMKILTGQEDFRADSILRYFQPLYEWLIKENEGSYIGWV